MNSKDLPNWLVNRIPTHYNYTEGVVVVAPKFRLGDRVQHVLGGWGTIVEIKIDVSVQYDTTIALQIPHYLIRYEGETEDTWACERDLR